MKTLLVCVVFTVICVAVLGDSENARLLASKVILNQYAVENKDLTVIYEIYNIGGSPAIDARLVDKSFPDSDFEVVHGNLEVTWQRIGPGYNVSHVVILRPKNAGYFNFTAAEISYLPSETESEPQHGYTSAPGEGGIVSFRDYDRKFSSHVLDWAAFAVMTLPSLGIPFLLWHGSKSKYEAMKKEKKSS
jgi:translocon-associated protein subunit beta